MTMYSHTSHSGTPRWTTWLLCITAATSLHAAVIHAWLEPAPAHSGDAKGDGIRGLEIGLGQAGADMALIKQLTQPEPVLAPEPEPTPKPKARKKPVIKPQPVVPAAKPKPLPIAVPVKEAEPEPQAVAIATAPTPVAEPVPVKPKEDQPAPDTPSDLQATSAATTHRPESDVAAVKGSGKANHHKTGGKIGSNRDYLSHLIRTLLEYHKYPATSRKFKEEGTAIIKFTIDRQGNVLTSALKTSSGYPRLDQAALQALSDANPLPPVPPKLFRGRTRLPLEVPFEYDLTTNTTYKR